MSMLDKLAGDNTGEITLHREVKCFVVMLDGAKILEVADGDLEFFFMDFSPCRAVRAA